MAQSTGPMLALGLISWGNGAILEGKGADVPFTARVVVGTSIAAGSLVLVERISPEVAKGIAWIALVTTLFVRIGGRESPIDNLLKWWND
jgi:hypothetical protein